MRLLVTGSRTWTDRAMLFESLDELHRRVGIDVLIEGCAHGADELAGNHPPDPKHMVRFGHPFEGGWAWHRGVGWQHYEAEWRPDGRFDKAAGVKRNSRMLADSEPDLGMAFWDGESNGTADMIRKARTWGLEVVVLNPAAGRQGVLR